MVLAFWTLSLKVNLVKIDLTQTKLGKKKVRYVFLHVILGVKKRMFS